MQQPRQAALGAGALYALMGLAGFVATGFGGTGTLVIFPVSVVANLASLGLGLSGLAAYGLGPVAARAWAQAAGVLIGAMAVVGVVFTNPLGVLPLGGADVGLHAGTAVALLYLGFADDVG